MSNLRDRLRRIQEQKKNEKPRKAKISFDTSALIDAGWESCGFQTLKQEVIVASPLKVNAPLPQSSVVVIPDLAGRNLPVTEDFLFFDLETTGLSGGAGTVAFLAAFGKPLKNDKLCITQYLLLDYPGENDFLEAVLGEFENKKSVIVTYNGKCFDSQILKTRCLMNGIRPPEYHHADLLHPARRLWKKIIHDCSQGSIETRILGLDRSGDIPGALAPEIWFEFLNTGRTDRLMGICKHNTADITGLASILAAMISIAANPWDTGKYNYDLERLALYWRKFIRLSENHLQCGFDDLRIMGNKFLRYAADKKYPQAAYIYAHDQLRSENYEDGRKRMLSIVKSSCEEKTKAAAFRSLAIDSERRLKDAVLALEFVKRGMELKEAGDFWQMEFERRAQRLEKKLLALG